MTTSMPTIDQLVARLKAIKALRITVTAYRSTTPEYAKVDDLMTGEGSRLHGSRWNPPGIAAVYASFTPATAMEESLAHFRYYGIPFHAAMPRVFVAIKAQLAKVWVHSWLWHVCSGSIGRCSEEGYLLAGSAKYSKITLHEVWWFAGTPNVIKTFLIHDLPKR